MLRRDVADRLYESVCHRFASEQPNRELTTQERDAIWYDIYGRLCRGQTEQEVAQYCQSIELRKPKQPKIRNGY